MKKNTFAAVVILVITVAFLFVLNDLSKSEDQNHATTHNVHQQFDLVGVDID